MRAMKAIHKIAVQLHDGDSVIVHALATEDFNELYQVVEKNRADGTCLFPKGSAEEFQIYIPLLISRATGKSLEWINQRPDCDRELLYEAIREISNSNFDRQIANKEVAIAQAIKKVTGYSN